MRNMKDSGVEWIGEIPEDWEVSKLKDVSNFYNGFSFDSKDLVPDYKYPVIRIGDISDEQLDLDATLGIDNNFGLDSYLIKNEDILIAMSGATVGKVGIVKGDKTAYINQRVGILRSKMPQYIFYNLISGSFMDYIINRADGSAQPNISTDMIKQFQIAMPIDFNVSNISDAIKRKLKNISSIRTILSQEIKTLEAYKKSVITEAVTKGLDKNVEMKDSGIEWIGEIPKHWEVMPLKYFANINMGQSVSGVDILVERQGVPFIQGCAEFTDKYPLPKYWCITPNKLAPKDSVLMSVRAPVGELNIADQEYGIGRGLCAFNSSNNQYLYYLLLSNVDGLISYSNGSTYDAVTVSTLENYRVVVAPDSEKEEIVSYLDKKTQAIDEVIAIKQNQLSLLDEYKKSLIYEYVTGKREV